METNNQAPTMREQLSAILRKAGFATQETDERISFTYEGMDVVIFLTPDTTFLGMYVPNICYVEESNELKVLRRINEINNTSKYVKCFIPNGDTIWLSYERELAPDEVMSESLVEIMLDQLIFASFKLISLEVEEENA